MRRDLSGLALMVILGALLVHGAPVCAADRAAPAAASCSGQPVEYCMCFVRTFCQNRPPQALQACIVKTSLCAQADAGRGGPSTGFLCDQVGGYFDELCQPCPTPCE